MSTDQAIIIRQANVEEILDLRHVVLRVGLPRETARFEGDEEITTLHFAAEQSGRIVGCATFLIRRWDSRPAWQLRGMAVAPELRSAGIGARLLSFAEAEAQRACPTTLFWANARVPAIGFYLSHGWQIASEQFEIPTAGPHYKIVKDLSPARQVAELSPSSQIALEYGSPNTPPPQSIVSTFMLVVCLLTGIFLTIFLGIYVPRFESIFRDFKSVLPASTEFVIYLSRIWWFACAPVWIVLLVLPFAWPRFVVPPISSQSKRLRRLGWVLTTVLLAGVGVAMIFAMYLPMLNLIQAVSGQGGNGAAAKK